MLHLCIRALLECKHKYRLLSPIKIMLCVRVCCSCLSCSGMCAVPSCGAHVQAQPYSATEFLWSCFPVQTGPVLCQITLDHSGPWVLAPLHSPVLLKLLCWSTATSNSPGVYLALWTLHKQLFSFLCQCSASPAAAALPLVGLRYWEQQTGLNRASQVTSVHVYGQDTATVLSIKRKNIISVPSVDALWPLIHLTLDA